MTLNQTQARKQSPSQTLKTAIRRFEELHGLIAVQFADGKASEAVRTRVAEALGQDSQFWTDEISPALTAAKEALGRLGNRLSGSEWRQVQDTIRTVTDIMERVDEVLDAAFTSRRIENTRLAIARTVKSLRTAIKVERGREEAKRSLFHRGEKADFDDLEQAAKDAEFALVDTDEKAWTWEELKAELATIADKTDKLWTLIRTTCDHCGREKGTSPVVFEQETRDGRKVHREYCSTVCNERAAERARKRNGQTSPHAHLTRGKSYRRVA